MTKPRRAADLRSKPRTCEAPATHSQPTPPTSPKRLRGFPCSAVMNDIDRSPVIAPGTRIGPYEVISLLGEGGMGEVYRGRDPRLGRDVAIKILTQDSARDNDAMARFEREARAVASLSHPNILAIFDLGQHEGTRYVVTELLEGETLRERIHNTPMNWRKAVEIGAEIAEGLAAAHSRSVVHRDLKPEN